MRLFYSLLLSITLIFTNIDFSQLSQVLFNNEEVTAVYYDDSLVWANGSLVTYVINGVEYKEWVTKGESVLTPRTFTPETTTGTFCGWTEDKQNSVAVETLIAGHEPITLYALSRIDIIKDCVPNMDYIASSNCSDVPYNEYACKTHYYGLLGGCSGASDGFSGTRNLVLNDNFLNSTLYYNINHSLYNSMFNGHNSWYARISNAGNYIVNDVNKSWSNSYYSYNGSFVLEDTTITLSAGLSRGYNEDQHTQWFYEGIGFTNLYAIGVFE